MDVAGGDALVLEHQGKKKIKLLVTPSVTWLYTTCENQEKRKKLVTTMGAGR